MTVALHRPEAFSALPLPASLWTAPALVSPRAVELRRLHPLFGAEVQGLDLAAAGPEAAAAVLRPALRDHEVLVLRDQALRPDRQAALAACL
ncbi:Fe(II)-2OG oxygenase family protein, partial [Falsiroseomonas oryzae]